MAVGRVCYNLFVGVPTLLPSGAYALGVDTRLTTIYSDSGRTVQATVYAAGSGGTTLTQPLAPDINGNVLFWLAEGQIYYVTSGSQQFELNAIGYDATGILTVGALVLNAGRIQEAMGVAVSSANNLSLGSAGNLFHVTGSTQLNLLDSTGWQAGSQVMLIFDAGLTVKNNQTASGAYAPLRLNSNADFVAAANATLSLRYDGTSWWETGRKA